MHDTEHGKECRTGLRHSGREFRRARQSAVEEDVDGEFDAESDGLRHGHGPVALEALRVGTLKNRAGQNASDGT
jgi:hypothetical protein